MGYKKNYMDFIIHFPLIWRNKKPCCNIISVQQWLMIKYNKDINYGVYKIPAIRGRGVRTGVCTLRGRVLFT